MPPFENAGASLIYIIVKLPANVNKNVSAFVEFDRKNSLEFSSKLLDVFLGAVVQDADAHFLPIRRGEFLDAARVEGGTQPLLRVQPGTDRVLFLFRHILTPRCRIPQKRTYDTWPER